MATQGKQGSLWKEKTMSSSSSPRHTRKPNQTSSASKTMYVPKSQKNINSSTAVKHRPGIVLLGSKSAPVNSISTSSMRYADIVKGSTPLLHKTEEALIKRISDDKELFLPSDFPAISAEKTNRNRVKRVNKEEMKQLVRENSNNELKIENQIDDVKEEINIDEKIKNVEEEQSVQEVNDHQNETEMEMETEQEQKHLNENETEEFVIVPDHHHHHNEDETEAKTEEFVVVHHHNKDETGEFVVVLDHHHQDETEMKMETEESYNQTEEQEQPLQYEIVEEGEEKFLKPTEILKLMNQQTVGKEVAAVPLIRQVIRCSNNINNNRAAVKKEAATSAYNEVIEETASKLIAEENRNKVLALVGAFETVISLENEGINE